MDMNLHLIYDQNPLNLNDLQSSAYDWRLSTQSNQTINLYQINKKILAEKKKRRKVIGRPHRAIFENVPNANTLIYVI